jgi:hypothetical protein
MRLPCTGNHVLGALLVLSINLLAPCLQLYSTVKDMALNPANSDKYKDNPVIMKVLPSCPPGMYVWILCT